MKFKHFTMEELKKMTQDQQRGYLLSELILGACHSLIKDVTQEGMAGTSETQVEKVLVIQHVFAQTILLLKEAATARGLRFEEMLQQAVRAPKVLGYK